MAAACSYCGFCAPIGCHSGAKGSIDVTAIPLAEATKNLKVVPQAHVTAITSDDDGLATGVLYFKGGRQFWQPASVILSAFTRERPSPSAIQDACVSERPRKQPWRREVLHHASGCNDWGVVSWAKMEPVLR